MTVLKRVYQPLNVLFTAISLAKRRIIAKTYPVREFPKYEEFVKKVRRQNEKSVYASASELYFAAFFARDAIEAAEDLLYRDPNFAFELIPLLASHQGTQYNLITEEEPGRIHHEYRMSPKTYYEVTGEKLPQKVAEIYETLANIWEGNEKEMTYYGSVDATPLYIKLIVDYIELTNNRQLLDLVYEDKDGREKTIRASFIDAMDWIVNRVTNGPREETLSLNKPQQVEKRLPLLEYKKSSVAGITNQTWKDSVTSVLHENGSLANSNCPIATIELQGHVYDALIKSARILKKEEPQKSVQWKNLAANIQQIVLKRFWLPDRNYFAMAMDRNQNGKYSLVKTLTSDQTELLNSEFFDNLGYKKRLKYISGIINHVYNQTFLTDVGIRSRSLVHDNLVDFWDYHGSRAVWVKATYDFAKGLQKQGFQTLSQQLEIRILNGVRIAGNFYELFYVAPNGQVAYDPLGKKITRNHEEITATTIPEHMQTWTASAVAAIEFYLEHPRKSKTQSSWESNLENELIRKNPQVTLITSPRKAYKAFPKKYSYIINVEKGRKSEEKFTKRQQI